IEENETIKQMKKTVLRYLTEDKNILDDYNVLMTTVGSKIKVLISKEVIDELYQTIEKYALSLLKRVGTQLLPIYIGISEKKQDIIEFRKMAIEAEKAIELGKLRTRESTIVHSNELGHLS